VTYISLLQYNDWKWRRSDAGKSWDIFTVIKTGKGDDKKEVRLGYVFAFLLL
jgi:hypothetical protein